MALQLLFDLHQAEILLLSWRICCWTYCNIWYMFILQETHNFFWDLVLFSSMSMLAGGEDCLRRPIEKNNLLVLSLTGLLSESRAMFHTMLVCWDRVSLPSYCGSDICCPNSVWSRDRWFNRAHGEAKTSQILVREPFEKTPGSLERYPCTSLKLKRLSYIYIYT